MTLVPIGRFSEMTRLSIKALRLYDEIGLLVPAEVDPSSGYRYYSPAQANRAEAVRILRAVDMPLDEIQAVLDADDDELVHKLLVAHRERMADRLAAQERMLAYLETLIRRGVVMPYEVEVMEMAPQQVIATRRTTSFAKIAEDIPAGFGALMRVLQGEGLMPMGPPFLVYHDIIDEQTDGDIEICIPVGGEPKGDDEVYVREVEGGSMATTVHRGPYPEIAPAYHTVSGWISEHGHEMAGPPREVYLNDPQQVPEEELLTRVEWPIR